MFYMIMHYQILLMATGNECLKRKMTNITIIFQKTKIISKIWIMVKNEGVSPDIIQTISTIAWALGDLWNKD